MSDVDLEVLARWMDEQGLTGGPITDAEPLTGGTQNIMLRFTRGGRAFVLRRGPRHLRPKTNDALRREIVVLRALAATDVRCPGFIAGSEDPDVLGGAVFYLMEPVDGFNATVELPELHAGDAGVRHAMGLSAVRELAKLAAVDHVAVGLGDLGKPEGFLERQVPRWLSELESYGRHEGYGGPELPGLEAVAVWLQSNLPATFAPGIVHGDYHLANLMFRPDGPEVAAIVDWEMCTIGDPLLDLGWLLATWPDEHGSASVTGAIGMAGGLASRDELIARYAEGSTRDLSAIDWYTVMACFKLAIILEGTYARACAGKANTDVGAMLHAIAVGLFERAQRLV